MPWQYPLAPTVQSRAVVSLTAQGILSQTYDRGGSSNATATMIDGTVYFMLLGLVLGDTVTKLWFNVVGSAASGVTLSKVGLYTAAGARVALSADQGTAWQTPGIMGVALTTPYIVPATGGYYAAIVAKASVTLPTIQRSASGGGNSGNVGVIGTGVGLAGVQLGQTDLPATATVSISDANTICPYIAATS